MLPIYQSTETYKQAKLIFNDKSHSGLWFERFYDYQIFENNGNPLTNEQDKKKAKIESSIELNTQKNWHTSKMIDTISVIGNNNILSSILIRTTSISLG